MLRYKKNQKDTLFMDPNIKKIESPIRISIDGDKNMDHMHIDSVVTNRQNTKDGYIIQENIKPNIPVANPDIINSTEYKIQDQIINLNRDNGSDTLKFRSNVENKETVQTNREKNYAHTYEPPNNIALNQSSQSHNYMINIQQTCDKDSIIVETHHTQKKFIFYDRNKNFLGGFSVYEFVKYITSNISVGFLEGVDGNSVKPVIEKYICTIKNVNNPYKRYIINMLSYLESPFMGNIETLIKFYTFVHEFEKSNFENEIAKIPKSESVAVIDLFNNMIYTL